MAITGKDVSAVLMNHSIKVFGNEPVIPVDLKFVALKVGNGIELIKLS